MPVSLETRMIYGLKTDIVSNVHYLNDTEILYPVGNALAVHNIQQHQQRLIHLTEKQEINIICVTPNKKYVALSEVGEKPVISIYDIEKLKKKKTLIIPYDAPNVTKFNCMSFTFDSKHLIAVMSDPEQTMLHYNWEYGKLVSSFKAVDSQNLSVEVNLIACNPCDSGVVALGGYHIFTCLTVSETVWRAFGFTKANKLLITSMTWLSEDGLLLGTCDGKILYLENGNIKSVYEMSATESMNLEIKEEQIVSAAGSLIASNEEASWKDNIRCLTAFKKGFAYAFGLGRIVVFEKHGQYKYMKRNIYKIPPQMKTNDKENLYKVNTLNINPSMDQLVVATLWHQLFFSTLWGSCINTNSEPQELKVMGQPLHHGPITGLSMCTLKPLFMTFGKLDHTVRLWNFETGKVILSKQYIADICNIALHPTGLSCLIGFSDKLHFMTILVDDFLSAQKIAIRNCETLAFCNAGHLFAAVDKNIIQIYTTIGYYNSFTLKGHAKLVQALVWLEADTDLVTLDAEGSVYQWSVVTGTRTREIILKETNLHDIAISSDESWIYCIGSSHRIREIHKDSVVHETSLPGVSMKSIIVGKCECLFLGCSGGVIVSGKPSQKPMERLLFHVHCADITKIALSYNEQYLVSAAEDGSLCIWKLIYPKGILPEQKRDITYTEEVLINRKVLEENIEMINDLKLRLSEIETETAYKERRKDTWHNDKMREIHESYWIAIQAYQNKIESMREELNNQLKNKDAVIKNMEDSHRDDLTEMENSYNAKLNIEYCRYQALEDQLNAMREEFKVQLIDLEKRKDNELNEIVRKFEDQILEKNEAIERASEQILKMEKELNNNLEMKDSFDRKLCDMQVEFNEQLHRQKELVFKLQGTIRVMQEKYIAEQQNTVELSKQIQCIQRESNNLEYTLTKLRIDASNCTEQITKKDAIIQEKDQQICDLKCKVLKLEEVTESSNDKTNNLHIQTESNSLREE